MWFKRKKAQPDVEPVNTGPSGKLEPGTTCLTEMRFTYTPAGGKPTTWTVTPPTLTDSERRMLVDLATGTAQDNPLRERAEVLLADELTRIETRLCAAGKLSVAESIAVADDGGSPTAVAGNTVTVDFKNRQAVTITNPRRFNLVSSAVAIRAGRVTPGTSNHLRTHFVVGDERIVVGVTPGRLYGSLTHITADDLDNPDPTRFAPCDADGSPLPGWTPPTSETDAAAA